MYSLFRKLHMYAGLLNLSLLLIVGISGLWGTFEPAPDQRHRPDPQIEFRDFTVPAGVDDKAVADQVYEYLKLPMSVSISRQALRRDGNNNLALDFYGANGMRRAIVLEKENRIRIE